jgi:hypothetical protein
MECPVDHARVLESGDSALLWVTDPPEKYRPWDDFTFTHCPNCGKSLSAPSLPVPSPMTAEALEAIRWEVYRSLDKVTTMQNGEQQAALRGMKLFQDAILKSGLAPVPEPATQIRKAIEFVRGERSIGLMNYDREAPRIIEMFDKYRRDLLEILESAPPVAPSGEGEVK